jgi:hypothetical protein
MHDHRLRGFADAVHAALGEALAADVSALSDGELLEAAGEVYRAEARLAACKARLVGEIDARNAHAAVGAQSAAAYLTHACGLPRGRAGADVRLARSLRRLPATAAALADGDIGEAQAAMIARHQRNPRTAASTEEAEATLVADAARLPVRSFTTVLAYWAQLVDPDGAEDGDLDRRARRHLSLSQTFEGMWRLDGLLDPISGAAVDNALRRIADDLYDTERAEARDRLGRDPSLLDLERTPGQRRADALVELAHRATATPPGSRRPQPLVSILVGYETFAGRVCELADGTVVAPGTVAALLDDAVIERAVFDGPARVLDIGAQRRFTGALRRAIELRDRTCTHPYCDVPVDRCDIDHEHPWEWGGPTTQDNGRGHCPFHNHLRQRRGPPGYQSEWN